MTMTNEIAGVSSMSVLAEPKTRLPIAGLGHIQSLASSSGFVRLLSTVEALGFDANIELDIAGPLSILASRHVSSDRYRTRYSYGYGYNAREEDIPGKPVVFAMAYTDHMQRDATVIPSARLGDAIVSIHFVFDNASNWGYYNYHDGCNFRLPQCIVEVVVRGIKFPIGTTFANIEVLTGAKVTRDLKVRIGNRDLPANFKQLREAWVVESGYKTLASKFDFTFSTLEGLRNKTQIRNPDSLNDLVWGLFVGENGVPTQQPARMDGVAKTYARVGPIADSIYQTHPIHYLAFRSWVAETAKALDGIKISSVFNEAFKNITDKAALLAVLQPMTQRQSTTEAIRETDAWKAKRKNHLKNTTGRAFTKLMQDKDFLLLDRTKFPLLDAAIESGEIPVSVFIRKEEQYFLLNGNFPLWEEMLKRYRDVTIELAQAAAPRQKFEKDLMSYFYFVLYGLPEYLKKHTKKKWTCSPKLVDSMTELDAPDGDESGIVRSRSSLTPHVDNEKCHVVVPYASLRISGQKVQYCYSHDYHVLQRGFSFNGNVVISDLEEKLNGKDDYGLMFYTLTGTDTAKGYPTFLIIFEKRVAGVHVHFHRTHPSRSKEGDYNPIHDWTKVCYNWGCGNVLRTTLKYQQGDLLFIPLDDAAAAKIDGFAEGQVYDNHWFETPVQIAPSTIKSKSSNSLGHVRLAVPTRLMHKEHDPVAMDSGVYEIRQFRSWEANPKSVWVLRID